MRRGAGPGGRARRRWLRVGGVAVSCLIGVSRGAAAQPASGPPERGYVEGVVQAAFGNVTSQAFGGEAGVTLGRAFQAFVEAGRVRDAAPASLGPRAQLIASYLAQTQAAAVGFSVKQPVTYGLAGLRYRLPGAADFAPYVLAGAGVARDTRAVHFTVGGTDVTDTIAQYGVALGTDLAGRSTSALLAVGGGVVWHGAAPLVVDLQYRYGRIFASDAGVNLHRAGLGLGVRF